MASGRLTRVFILFLAGMVLFQIAGFIGQDGIHVQPHCLATQVKDGKTAYRRRL